jgi:protein gp37
MNKTAIEWTDFSANPLKFRDVTGAVVWGCVHASPGCLHCYSETLAKRYGRGGPFNVQTMAGLTPFLDDAELHKMLTAKTVGGKAVSGSRVFVGDMTDIFGEWVPDALLDGLFAVFALRPDVTFQILTKRAERMRDYFAVDRAVLLDRIGAASDEWTHGTIADDAWPLKNVWLGVSCENQRFADERIPLLLQTPAAVRFISAEPLLEGIDIAKHRPGALGLHWVIAGGESGAGARPAKVWWFRNLLGQCRDADVPFFMKQLGSNPAGDDIPPTVRDEATGKRTLHLRQELTIRDRKGGDPSEWPADLRVREFPAPRRGDGR